MPIITITSDWNKNDYYLPALKGRLFSLYSTCIEQNNSLLHNVFNVVDISNSIRAFDIFEACFILKNSYHHFPDGSIHIIAVESELQRREGNEFPDSAEEHGGCVDMAVVKARGHYFIGPDDGRFGLLFDGLEGVEGYRLSGRGKDNLGGVLELAKNKTFAALGLFEYGVKMILEDGLQGLDHIQPKGSVVECAAVSREMIVGRVVYIDSYGNAIANISRENFFKVVTAAKVAGAKNISYVIYVQGPYIKFENISENYADVDEGEEVALFNSLDLLEFAINKGNFAAMEGIDTTAEVVIKFKFS